MVRSFLAGHPGKSSPLCWTSAQSPCWWQCLAEASGRERGKIWRCSKGIQHVTNNNYTGNLYMFLSFRWRRKAKSQHTDHFFPVLGFFDGFRHPTTAGLAATSSWRIGTSTLSVCQGATFWPKDLWWCSSIAEPCVGWNSASSMDEWHPFVEMKRSSSEAALGASTTLMRLPPPRVRGWLALCASLNNPQTCSLGSCGTYLPKPEMVSSDFC